MKAVNRLIDMAFGRRSTFSILPPLSSTREELRDTHVTHQDSLDRADQVLEDYRRGDQLLRVILRREP